MFREFALCTGIRGFHYAQAAKSSYVKVIWILIMALCVSLTIWDISSTVIYYSSNPTGTKTTIFANQTLDFDQPTLCIPFTNHFANSGVDNLSAPQVTGLLKANLDEILKLFETRTYRFLDETFKTKLLSLMIAVVSSITREQYELQSDRQSFDYGWGFAKVISFDNGSSSVINEGSELISAAHDFFELQNINISTLINTAAYLACKEFKVTLEKKLFEKEFSIKEICDISLITWLGMSHADDLPAENFCMRMPKSSFYFTSTSDYIQLTFHHPQQFFHFAKQNSNYGTIDFMSHPVLLPNSYNLHWFPFGYLSDCRFNIAARYKINQALSNQPCSNDVMKSMCFMKCRDEFVRNWCNCTTILLGWNNNSFPDCTVNHFKDAPAMCKTIRTKRNPDKKCTEKCVIKCDYFLVNFVVDQLIPSQEPNKTELSLWVNTFRYPMFEEVSLVGPKQFFAALGGNLSLYLGASFVVLLHAVMFWCGKLGETLYYTQVQKDGQIPTEKYSNRIVPN